MQLNNNPEELSSSHAGGNINMDAIDTSHINDVLMAGDKSKGARPYFFNDKENEKVLNIAMAVATEVAVIRERIDTIERLLENRGLLNREDIDAFTPTEAQAQERQLWHARYAARILRIMQQEMDAVANPQNNMNMQQIADEINEM